MFFIKEKWQCVYVVNTSYKHFENSMTSWISKEPNSHLHPGISQETTYLGWLCMRTRYRSWDCCNWGSWCLCGFPWTGSCYNGLSNLCRNTLEWYIIICSLVKFIFLLSLVFAIRKNSNNIYRLLITVTTSSFHILKGIQIILYFIIHTHPNS